MTAAQIIRSTAPWRTLIVAFWIAAAAALFPYGLDLESRLDTHASVAGSEHAQTADLISRDFDTPLVDPIILILEDLDPTAAAGAQTLAGLLATLNEAVPGTRTISYLDAHDPLFVGADARSAVVLIALPTGVADRSAHITALRAAATSFVVREHARARLSWTSESMINDELRELSARDANAAELRILPVALVVLLIAFGSVVAGVTPVAIGFLTVALARGALALVDTVSPLSVLTANVATMLGLGLSLDYALLIVSRFREELAIGDAHAAAAATAASAGRTVALSGAGVAIALAALLLTPINEVRAIAISGLIVVAVAVGVSTTLLPVALSFIGSRIDALSVRRRTAPKFDNLWRGWARVVFARPIAFTLLGAAPLLALALHSARLDISLPRGDWSPSSAAAANVMDTLDRIERTGLLQTILVTAQLEPPDGAASEAGWRAIEGLDARIAADPRVTATRSILSAADGNREGWRHLSLAPEETRRSFLSGDNRTALIAVVPRSDLELYELSQLARDLRALTLPNGVVATSIGGSPALTADYSDAIASWFAPVAALVLGATFLILIVGLRSLLLPLKAVALNLLSVTAALGAMTLVFQDGFGAQLLNLPGPYHAVFPIIPILVFSIVFGLSMDYEVFLFHRVVEAHRTGASNMDAMTLGLSATGGLITSAAALMIIVFGAFTLGDFLLMKMLGFSLAAAILIDAVLVRLVLGPALFALAGRWNWWPFRRL